jgi:hypothetical protein
MIPGDGTARVEDRAQVRLDHRAPVVVAHAREQRVAGHARVVDEDVGIAGLLDEPLGAFGGRDVRLHGSPADLGRDRVGLLGAGVVADHDRGPGLPELDRNRTSDAARPSGDEGRPP